MEIKKKVTNIRKCRISGGKLINVFHLGKQPLANSFIKKYNSKESKFDLSTSYCSKSFLFQLNQTVNKNLLFDKYLWVSGTGEITIKYADLFCKRIINKVDLDYDDLILEIASNDGTFLSPFIKKGFNKVIGIDPAKNIAKIANNKKIKTLNKYWNFENSKKIKKKYGYAKVVIARNVIPHVSNLIDFIKGIEYIMDENGIGAIEFHDASHIQSELQYDSIYHEHLCYFSLKSISYLLNKFYLYPFDLDESPINAGNKLIFFSKKKKNISKNLSKARRNEVIYNVNSLNSWKLFAKKSIEHKEKIISLIHNFQNKKIIGFGSSARSQTLLNFCGINYNYIDAIIDNNKLKHGLYTPGTGIPIVNFKKGMLLKPDLIIILAWNFKNEILNLCKSVGFKGQFIIPFPNSPYLSK